MLSLCEMRYPMRSDGSPHVLEKVRVTNRLGCEDTCAKERGEVSLGD
jgi:hypothetical protein